MKAIIQEALNKGISFKEYRSLFEQLVAEGNTTGPNQSEGYVSYTKLNWTRWTRTEKNAEITRDTFESLQDINENITLLIITEAWCGDAFGNGGFGHWCCFYRSFNALSLTLTTSVFRTNGFDNFDMCRNKL